MWKIYTKDGCPACAGAKQLMEKRGYKFQAIRGEEHNPRPSYKTWPKIYNPKGKFIGGFGDLQKL